jgi:hypothetical protein
LLSVLVADMRHALPIFTISKHPTDFPQHYTVHARIICAGGETLLAAYCGLYDSLDEARADIPSRLYCIPRHDDDETQIVEVWL